MTPERMEELRRRMAEVSLLPHEHPERQALVREISGVDGPLEQEWLDLLREDERMRLELARVNPPPWLEERLLAIPGQHHPRAKTWLFRWMGAMAAVLVVGLGVWWAVAAARTHEQSAALEDFALLAIAADDGRPALSVTTSDWQALHVALEGEVPYPLQRPAKLSPGLRLIGGKAMTLAGHKVVYTRCQADGKTYSLYQFCAPDFGLRRPLERRAVAPRVSQSGQSRVIVWSEGHCDYALVVEEGDVQAANAFGGFRPEFY